MGSINMRACYQTFPAYFKTKTPAELIDLRKTPYSCAYGEEGKTFYEVLTSTPERLNMFNKAMMQMESNLPILGMFPFKSMKDEVVAEPERAFVVDIGGGRGQALLSINQETSNAFGTGAKMLLQDRPPVLDSIPQNLLPGIEKMPYDFYTEQPIKSISPPLSPDLSLAISIPSTQRADTPYRCTHLFSPTHNTQLPRWSLYLDPEEHCQCYVTEITSSSRRNRCSNSHRSW